MDLSDIIPARDYEFRMGLRRGDPAAFFRATDSHGEIVSDRQRWLDQNPMCYAGIVPGGEHLVEEVSALLDSWGGFALPEERNAALGEKDAWPRLLRLGATVEPDLLVLAPSQEGSLTLQAMCVCFPSSWRPEEKLGRPMSFIHEAAPGLNRSLGDQIGKFLSRLRPGEGWLRSNWGLSGSLDRNQHPVRDLPRIAPTTSLDRVWLRVERQCLVALPSGAGILFGLRIESVDLAKLRKESPENLARLAHAIETMPEDIALYKGIASARNALVERLRS